MRFFSESHPARFQLVTISRILNSIYEVGKLIVLMLIVGSYKPECIRKPRKSAKPHDFLSKTSKNRTMRHILFSPNSAPDITSSPRPIKQNFSFRPSSSASHTPWMKPMESVGYSMDDVTKGGHLLHPTIEMVTPREEKSVFFEIEENFWEENLKFFIRNSELSKISISHIYFLSL